MSLVRALSKILWRTQAEVIMCLHSPSFQSKWNEVRQGVQLPSFQYSFPGLQMQLLWVVEPASEALPFGQGVHSSEVSEKFSLNVFFGHFVHVAPVPVLRCSHIGWEKNLRQPRHQPGIQVQSPSGANFSGDTCKELPTMSRPWGETALLSHGSR